MGEYLLDKVVKYAKAGLKIGAGVGVLLATGYVESSPDLKGLESALEWGKVVVGTSLATACIGLIEAPLVYWRQPFEQKYDIRGSRF